MSEDDGRFRLLATARDIGLVTFGKYGQYVITVVTVPLMARLLGTEGLGLVAIAMSSYFVGSVLVDLGIAQFLSAMMNREDVRQLRGNYLVIRAVTLSTIGAALLLGLAFDVGVPGRLILLGMFAGGLSSISEDWVLIGQARFLASTGYQAVGRATYLALLIALLPRLPHAEVALLCLMASGVVTVGLTWRDSLRRFGSPARPHEVLRTVRMGVTLLSSRLLVLGYGQGSTAIYSAVLTPASLGLFSAGDRLVRAVQSVLDPIGFALLPRMARIGHEDRFWRRGVLALVVSVLLACLAAATLWVTAPVLVDIVFGSAFADAIPLLRVEALILPATTLTSFTTTAILPVRKDAAGVLIGAVIGVCVAAVWLYVAVRTGSVWSLVYGSLCCEVAVALWYVSRMWRLYLRDRNGSRPVSTAVEGASAHAGGGP
jgi:O-antigen/teichoic acid export membrane protein